jgi:hypothetical protein
MYTLELIGIAIAMIVIGLIIAGCIRKWGSHTLINGFMSEEKADAVFPHWRKCRKKKKEEDS